MTEPSERGTNGGTAINRREFDLVRQMFEKQFSDHEKLDKERHEVLDRDIKAIRENYHSLNNRLTPLFSLPDRMARMEDNLKDVPRKEDLEYITQSMKAGFQNLNDERLASERRLSRLLTVVGIAITVIIAAVTILVNVLRH